MPNITLSVNEEIIKKVRKIAVDRNTTLTAMVREYLHTIAAGDAAEKQRTIDTVRQSFREWSRDMGPRTWTRDSLHER